jgi:hypothetical protein
MRTNRTLALLRSEWGGSVTSILYELLHAHALCAYIGLLSINLGNETITCRVLSPLVSLLFGSGRVRSIMLFQLQDGRGVHSYVSLRQGRRFSNRHLSIAEMLSNIRSINRLPPRAGCSAGLRSMAM